MENRFAFALAAVTVLAASTSAAGCSSGDEAPPTYAMGGGGAVGIDAEETSELAALDVAADEPIVDESNVDEGRDTAEENPLAADEEEVAAVQILSAPPIGEAQVGTKGRSFKCRGSYSGSCVCAGSPLNCELPNDQPGRNRYLPPSFVAEVNRRGLKFGDVLEAGRWEVTPGSQIYDGQGNARGTFKNACLPFATATGGELRKDTSRVCVQINFGQMKNMKVQGDTAEHTYVYAFAVDVAGPGAASGWIRLSTVVDKTELAKMGSHAARRANTFAPTKYVLKSAEDWGQTAASFSQDKLPTWSRSGVGKSSDSVKPMAGHYLLRNGNVINLIYSTPGAGGASTDTFLVGHEQLAFRRVKSTHARPTLVRIGVENPSHKSMVFAYGSIEGRFGWMALSSIKKGTVSSATPPAGTGTSPGAGSGPAPGGGPAPSVCDGKADGTYCDDTFPMSGYTCAGGKLATALECPPPFTKCTGASADGKSLVCAY
jgi:hypothetical protein